MSAGAAPAGSAGPAGSVASAGPAAPWPSAAGDPAGSARPAAAVYQTAPASRAEWGLMPPIGDGERGEEGCDAVGVMRSTERATCCAAGRPRVTCAACSSSPNSSPHSSPQDGIDGGAASPHDGINGIGGAAAAVAPMVRAAASSSASSARSSSSVPALSAPKRAVNTSPDSSPKPLLDASA
eukprot:3589028-Prymnesium_polylepis.1